MSNAQQSPARNLPPSSKETSICVPDRSERLQRKMLIRPHAFQQFLYDLRIDGWCSAGAKGLNIFFFVDVVIFLICENDNIKAR